MDKEVKAEPLGMFWEISQTFGVGFFFIGEILKGDRRFDDFTHFLEERVGLVERRLCSRVSRG